MSPHQIRVRAAAALLGAGFILVTAISAGGVAIGTAAAQSAARPPAPPPAAPVPGAARPDAPPLEPGRASPSRPFILGTGVPTGLYLPVGASICAAARGLGPDPGMRCLLDVSGGSLANLEALRAGRIDAALVQSDLQRQALVGEGPFADAGPYTDLRAVVSLHAETLVVLAGPESGVAEIGDLPGRRINLGPPGTAVRQLADLLLKAHGWTADSFLEVASLGPDDQIAALCEGILDVAVLAVGHPNGALRDAMSGCGAYPVALNGPKIAALLADRPDLVVAEIPEGFYPGLSAPVPSFGVVATLVTRSDVAAADIRALVAAILAGLPRLAASHPALLPLADADAQRLRLGLTAPLHPGAADAFAAMDGAP